VISVEVREAFNNVSPNNLVKLVFFR